MVLVSEMLLRKTRAATVNKVVGPLFKKYPTPRKMSNAKLSELATILKPLGLYRVRSKALKDVSAQLNNISVDKFLSKYENIISLPHVGRYTANAVLCMCYEKQVSMVDANIVRLMNRVFSIKEPRETHKADYIWDFVNGLIPQDRAREFNLAMLDLTALICLPKKPRCKTCPICSVCSHQKLNST